MTFFNKVIRQSVTLNVPERFANLQLALDYLADKRIADNAEVTIQIADGTYVMSKELLITHPDANKLILSGNGTTPGNVILDFPATGDGIKIIGVYLRAITGIKFRGASNATGRGVYVDRGNLEGGTIHVEGFGYGVFVNGNSYYSPSTTVISNTGDGLVVRQGSYAYVGSVAISNVTTGITVDYNSAAYVSTGSITTATTGFSVARNSYLQALSAGVTLTSVSSASNIALNTRAADQSYIYR